MLEQAHAVGSSLSSQGRLFDNVAEKVTAIGARFPVVNGLLNAIRRKKSKVWVLHICLPDVQS